MGVTKGTKTLVYNRPRLRERPFFLSFLLATGEKSDQCFCDQSFEVKIQRKNGFLFVADLGSLSNPVSLSFCPSFSVSFLYLFLSPPLTFSSYVPLHLSPFVSFPPPVSLSFSLLLPVSLSFSLLPPVSLCISFLPPVSLFVSPFSATETTFFLQKSYSNVSKPWFAEGWRNAFGSSQLSAAQASRENLKETVFFCRQRMWGKFFKYSFQFRLILDLAALNARPSLT